MALPFGLRQLAKLAKDGRGAEIAETAVVLPLVLILLFGIMWFGRAFNIYATLNRAAREAAKASALASCATCGNEVQDGPTIQANVVNPILLSAHLDPSRVQDFTLQQNVPLNTGSTPLEYGSTVSLSYPWNFKLNGFTCCPVALTPITTGITLTAQAQARQEN